jgi:hypothetical protein
MHENLHLAHGEGVQPLDGQVAHRWRLSLTIRTAYVKYLSRGLSYATDYWNPHVRFGHLWAGSTGEGSSLALLTRTHLSTQITVFSLSNPTPHYNKAVWLLQALENPAIGEHL